MACINLKGDIHNRGRSVLILYTDAGRLVYKPRDMHGESLISEFVQRFFPDALEIPACVAGEGFGFSEFVEKERWRP